MQRLRIFQKTEASKAPTSRGDEEVGKEGEYAHKYGNMQYEYYKRVAPDKAYGAVPFAVQLREQGLAGAIEEWSRRGAPKEVGKILHDGEHVPGRDVSLIVKKAGIAPKVVRREEEREVDGGGFGRRVAEVEYQSYGAKSYAAYRDGAFVATAEEVHKRV